MSELRPIAYPKSTAYYIGTEVRGLVSCLREDLPPLRFGDKKGDKFILRFNMDNDIERKQYETALESKDFKNGTIFKVKSPDEIKEEAKTAEQQRNLNLIKESIAKGYMKIPLDTMSWEQLLGLGDHIGAQTSQLNTRTKVVTKVNKITILSSIRELLGIEKEKEEPDPVEEIIPDDEGG